MDPTIWELFDPANAPQDGNLEPYLVRVLEFCSHRFRAAGTSIFLGEGDKFELAGQLGTLSNVPFGTKIQTGIGIGGASLEQRRPLLVGDPTKDAGLASMVSQARTEIGSAMVVPLLVPTGEPLGLLNVSRPFGDEPLSEEDLREAAAIGHQVALAIGNARLVAETRHSNERFQSVVNSVPFAVLIGRKDHLEGANLAGRELPAEVLQWLQTAEPGRRRLRDPLGDSIWDLSVSGEDESRVITVEDVTDQERESEERARLRRLAEIGQMTAAIAHEIRNPLTGIRGAAQMIAQSPEHGLEFAQVIEQEAIKLNALCDEFLEYARPLKLHSECVSLPKLVERVVGLEAPEFYSTGIKLTYCETGEGPKISLDPRRIEQVVRNLLRNAMQACQAGGRVSVRAGTDFFEVEDTGVGMEREALDRLFTPFFTTKAKGTGLGLSNVMKIVEAHEGTIEVRSTPGTGSVFTVRIGSGS